MEATEEASRSPLRRGGTFNCIDHPGIQAWIMWKRALDIPQTSSRLLGLNISIFIASLIQLCTRHRAKFPFFLNIKSWLMQTASKRFSGEEDCCPVWVCWRWWKPAFQGEQHWMFPPSSIVSQRHCRVFFLNPPFLSIRPSPHLTNWTFGARRHTTGTTTDTCWIYSAFVCKSPKTARVREHRASSVHSRAEKRWAVSLSC